MKQFTEPSRPKSIPAIEAIDPTLPTPAIVNLAIIQFLTWYLTIPVAPPQQPPQQPPPPPIPLPPEMAGLSRAQMQNAIHGWVNADCPVGPVTVMV